MKGKGAAADVVLLKHRLTALGLPTMKAECEQSARQCASENVDYLSFLLRLCERELAGRERRAFPEWPGAGGPVRSSPATPGPSGREAGSSPAAPSAAGGTPSTSNLGRRARWA